MTVVITGRIYVCPARDFGGDYVFKDVDSNPFGGGFVEHLECEVQKCKVYR
jgi:hypothetical protein